MSTQPEFERLRRVTEAAGAVSVPYFDANGDEIVVPVGAEDEVLTVSSGVPTWAPPGGAAAGGTTMYVRATCGGTQALTNGSYTTIPFSAEELDSDNQHDTATNNSRLTCVRDGIYAVSAAVGVDASAVGVAYCRFIKNGSTTIRSANIFIGDGGISTRMNLTALVVPLTVGDYLEFQIYRNTVGLNTIVTPDEVSHFEWFLVSPT